MQGVIYNSRNLPSSVNNTRNVNYPPEKAQHLSIKQESDIEYDSKIDYFCVNSSDRDTSKYPKVNSYRIDLNDTFKNITSIEIISGSVANKNSVQNFPYLIVKLDSLDHSTFSNVNVNKGFALLYLKATSGAHVNPELGCLQRNVFLPKTPIASLKSISIKLLKPDGTLFDFGEASANTDVEFSNSFVFKIITREKNRSPIASRSVF
jgi:hypothetical protein